MDIRPQHLSATASLPAWFAFSWMLTQPMEGVLVVLTGLALGTAVGLTIKVFTSKNNGE